MLPDRALASSAIGTWPARLTPLDAGGYTRSRTWWAQTQDGSVFLKEASDDGSLAMLRTEAIIYANVSGSFLPALVGFAEDGDRAVLALFAALEQTSSTTPPPELPAHEKWHSLGTDRRRPRTVSRSRRLLAWLARAVARQAHRG